VLIGTDAWVIDKLIRLAGPNYQRVLATVSNRIVARTRW